MKTRHIRHTLAAVFLSAFSLQAFSPFSAASPSAKRHPTTAAPAPAETFSPRALGETGLIAADTAGTPTALFLPAALPSSRMPASLALVQRPKITAPLPATWPAALVPQFSYSPTRTRVTIPVAAGTSLYGTGEATGPLLRNGQSNILWNIANAGYHSYKGLSLYQSHPWVLAVRADGTAFGIIADTTWRTELHTGANNQIEFTSDGPSFPVIIIDRSTPQEVLRALAALTGHMELPPLWALGYQQCRYSYTPDSRVREIADEFRARKIPCDVLWLDIDYMDGFRNFTFNPKTFPDPDGLNAYLRDRGFKNVWILDAGIKADDPDYRVFTDGTAKDVWTHTAAGAPFIGNVWPGPCVFPDFTRPETTAWWAALNRDFVATNHIDGIWNDMNEPAIFGTQKTMPLDAQHRGGPADADLPALEPNTHARYHNAYGMLEARATRAGLLAANPDKRPFVLSRAGYLGSQRYAAMWTGDNSSTWDHLRLSVPMSLNIGLSGQPFTGPDLGGHQGPATPDLWGNWVATGVFFPFVRGHSNEKAPPKEPWAFGPEVESAARTAIERRYRLLPYYYTLFREASLDGMPVMRPVFLADPRDPALRAEQQAFLVGDDLLVIPKWADHPTLPKGNWRTITLLPGNAEQDNYQSTLRIRPGAIIPLGRVIQNTTEKSLAPLTLLVSLDANNTATGQLYEDAGDGYAYRSGDYLLTTYRATLDPATNTVTVAIAATEGHRARPPRKLVIELITDTAAAPLTAEGTDGQPVQIRLNP